MCCCKLNPSTEQSGETKDGILLSHAARSDQSSHKAHYTLRGKPLQDNCQGDVKSFYGRPRIPWRPSYRPNLEPACWPMFPSSVVRGIFNSYGQPCECGHIRETAILAAAGALPVPCRCPAVVKHKKQGTDVRCPAGALPVPCYSRAPKSGALFSLIRCPVFIESGALPVPCTFSVCFSALLTACVIVLVTNPNVQW